MKDDHTQLSPNNFITDSINLFDLLKYFWKLKFVFLIFLLLSIIYSSYIIRSSTFEYEVKLTVIALEDKSISFSSIQGLNEILGIKSTSGDTSLSLYKSLIKSEYISDIMSKDLKFMKTLAGPLWDEDNNSILQNKSSNRLNLMALIKNVIGIPIFKSNLTNSKFVYNHISSLSFRTSASGLTEVYFNTDRPKVGQDLLNKAHNATEEFLKKRNINKTLKNIEFINSKLSKPIKSNNKAALIKMLVEQNQSLMIASSDIPYAAEAFSSPTISEFPVAPNYKLIISYNLVIAMIIFTVFATFLYIYTNYKKVS